MAGALFLADGSIQQQAIYAVLGGVLLAGQHLPLGDGQDEAHAERSWPNWPLRPPRSPPTTWPSSATRSASPATFR